MKSRSPRSLSAVSLLLSGGLASLAALNGCNNAQTTRTASTSPSSSTAPLVSEPLNGSTNNTHAYTPSQQPAGATNAPEIAQNAAPEGAPNQPAHLQVGTVATAPTGATTQPAAGTPASGTAPATAIIPRRPGKLDPFWIEATAEADRAVWAANDPLAGATPPDARTISTGPLTTPAMQPLGDGAEGLTHVTFAAEGADFDPCVSNDNTFMAFSSTQHRSTADIYSKSVTGRTVTQLTSDPAHDIMPAISPDGRRIAFCSNRNGNWDVFVMSSRGGQAVQLSAEPTQELHPSWSPDGTKIAFCRLGQMSGRWELWVMDAANAQSAEFIGFGMFPQWCPKKGVAMGGKDKILYQRSRERGGRAFSIWTIDYAPGDAGSPTEIASSTSAAFINASWSPDAQHIVFASVDSPAAGAAAGGTAVQGTLSELWMVNLDGTGRVALTTGGRFMNLMPCWGADNRIYFVSDRTGVPNIWAIGTGKAVQAATGFPTAPLKTDFATAPSSEEEQSAPSGR